MDWAETIRRCFEANKVLYSRHARVEMREEEFGEVKDEDVYEAVRVCGAIEEYPSDRPHASALVFGVTDSGRPLHMVCAHDPDSDTVIVVTVYHPDPARWKENRIRK